MRGKAVVHHRSDAAGLVALPLALNGPRADLLAQRGQFRRLGPLPLCQRPAARVVFRPGQGTRRSIRRQAGEDLDQVLLPPQRPLCGLLRQVIEQRGRAQRGPLADAEDSEVLGRLEVDLVDEHARAVDIGQANPHPGQSDDRVRTFLEPDPAPQTQPPRTRGPHDRPHAARLTTVPPPSGPETRSAVSSCRQSR